MKSSFGKNLKINIWGGSHEPAIGVDIEGLPLGTQIDMEQLQQFMKRRAPGNSPFATKRKEPDVPIPKNGFAEESKENPESTGKLLTTTSDKVSLEILNTDTRSSDYKSLASVPRPGHADYTARLRYGDTLNMAGGGPFSARMTAPLCIAGAIALQLLGRRGIEIGAHVYSVAHIKDVAFDPISVDAETLKEIKQKDFPVINAAAGAAMAEEILKAKADLDSVGGVVEACAVGLPGGIGGAMYDGLESALAPILFGIPAVKGVEFGAGFGASQLRGSENNDAFYYDGDTVKTETNNHGGILGGITTGMPLITRIAFKPTPSIGIVQDSVDLNKKINTQLKVAGRHDPCVVLRAVPIVEAALALGILDCIMEVNND